MRTTIATLKTTCAHRIAGIPAAGRIALIPVATTTAGIKNGIVMSAVRIRAARKECREIAHVKGRPTTSVSAVDATACHRVNHQTPRNEDSVSVLMMSWGRA